MTVDIITELEFGKSFDLLHEAKDATFDVQFVQAFDQVANSTQIFYHFPALRWVITVALPTLCGYVGLAIGGMTIFLQAVEKASKDFQSARSSRNVGDGEVILERLVDLSPTDFVEEARNILVAGSDTTASTLSNAVYYICSNPDVKDKLIATLDEYATSHDGKMDLSSLEKIPYLSACVKESIRIAMPVPGGLPRVVPEPQPGKAPFMVEGHVVPPKASSPLIQLAISS
ncbi:cytochrome P450 protein [Rutstroemia sp. NJR-2017a BBW]|nr:cytochrome P450 protein [Rutstroemia sp. NJR-2017a BBW]